MGKFSKTATSMDRLEAAKNFTRRQGWDVSTLYVVVNSNDISERIFIGDYWQCNGYMRRRFVGNPYTPLALRSVIAIGEDMEVYMGTIISNIPKGIW